MFEKLAQQIIAMLHKGIAVPEEGPPERHADLVRKLTAVRTFDDLLDALAELDGLVSAYVTLELSRYATKTPIRSQTDRSVTILRQCAVVRDAYRLVAQGAAKQIAAPTGDLATVAARITIDKASAAQHRLADGLLREVHGLLLLGLWVASRDQTGAELIGALARAPKASLTLRVQLAGRSSSLVAYPAGPDAHCTSNLGPTRPADALGMVTPVTPGQGAGSDMGVPVWVTGTLDRNLGPWVFDQITAEQILTRTLSGSVSFTRDRAPFYTPPRVDLLHELIHVLHNACGTNREKLDLPKAEKEAFDNAEEYWTIHAGDITENGFNAAIGAPDRWGHSGLTVTDLDRSSDAAEASLADHAGF